MEDTEEISEESEVEPEFVSSVPPDIIQLNHSFGYDCKRIYNMVLIDDDTLVFASGTYIHYFSVSKRTVTFRKSVFGTGIGFITKNYHPDFQGLLTIGENGPQATVFVYEYPSHNIRVKMEKAAKQQFTCGSYNHSGELFASQAGYPDFMLTIWRWEAAEIILRSKAFQNDVLHVHFSKFNPILLVSCGLSHIKFWKMANTFTGLKLKGDLGRFGKTDFSDIYAIYMLADENVISGCEWGNMLLWEAGLIKFEITRKGRKPCHTKPIVRITMEGGEVTTVGMDGYVRVWFWETIDMADPPDEDRFVEIEPIYEFYVGECENRAVQKIKLFDNEDFGYYMMDGLGGIWYCELNPREIQNPSYKLYSCHGGKIVAAQVSSILPLLVTLGEDGKISVYDFETKILLLQKEFNKAGTDLIWFNGRISLSGMDLVASFEDGVIRQIYIDLKAQSAPAIHLTRAIKAHTAAVTKMTVNPRNSLLVTGAADRTIFVYNLSERHERLDCVHLHPMGFVQFDAIPNCFNWKDEKLTILIGCKTGEVYEYRLPPKISEEQTFLSYNITDKKEIKATKFASVKSVIRRDLKRAAIKKRKDKKRKRKLDRIEKLKKANPGLQIDMEQALADSEPDEEEEPLHIPAVPNPILWLRYTDRNTIWVSMGGYDAGYIYELQPGIKEPIRSTIIKDGDDCEIHSYLDVGEILVLGLVNGKLRINQINPTDFTDMRNYLCFNMHDPLNGTIPSILSSCDGKSLISVGYDGNIFIYSWFGPEIRQIPRRSNAVTTPLIIPSTTDIIDPNYPSLEQEKIYAEQKRQEEAAAAHERKILAEIARLQEKFDRLMMENKSIKEDLRIEHKYMLLDDRITKQIQDELQFELDDVRDDLAYDLEVAEVGKQKLYDHFIKNLDHIPIKITSFGSSAQIYTFRIERLDENFEAIKTHVEELLHLEALKRREDKFEAPEEKGEEVLELPEETFFFGRDPNTIVPRFSRKMVRLLLRYRSRQLYEVQRLHNWEKMEKRKPDPNKNHPDDDRKIEEAQRTLGDYKLKTGAQYEPQSFETLAYKYHEVLMLREQLHAILSNFNKRVFELRDIKKTINDFIEEKRWRLKTIHENIPEADRKHLMEINPINMDEEYPEINLIEKYFPGCGIEINDILYLEKKVEDLLPKRSVSKIRKFRNKEDEILELDQMSVYRLEDIKSFPSHSHLVEEFKQLPSPPDPAFYLSNEREPSPWLIEKRYRWLISLLNEQDDILSVVNQSVQRFDNLLTELNDDRLQVKYETDFMTSYLTAMNQELYIMRDSEQIENQLLSNAEYALMTRNQAQTSINALTRQIDELRKSCDRINDQIAVIQTKFMTNTKGHKFLDFLRRIFRKKWRPPKPPKNEDESSESSSEDESSSEGEEDTKSIDSTDMTAIRLDETHCPPGLERSMYELAFKLRADRHELEKNVNDALKQIDSKRDEVKEAQKNVKYHTDVYNKEKETLLAFRRKRQQELNKIYVSIFLQMHQIQHFREGEDFRDLSKAVLFDSKRLMDLKGRVGTLKNEEIETKRLHRINIVHLRRMNTDISFMRLEITRLESIIKEEMMKKFGLILNLDELEEEVLRKYVFELETTAEEDIRLIEQEMKKRREELALAQEELIKETRANCEKVNKLSVLTEEKNSLERILMQQQKYYRKWLQPPNLSWDRDIEKLTAIDKEQKELITHLEREIATLRVKAKPLQIHDGTEEMAVEKVTMPSDTVGVCPEMFRPETFFVRMVADDFAMDRCQNIVQKLFMHRFGKSAGPDNVRRYAYKVTRYLGQAAYSFEGELTDNIMECIVENIRTLIPKKYIVLVAHEDLKKMFTEILSVFDYERSEVNTEDVVCTVYENAKETLKAATGVLNTAQYVLVHMVKELIEILPIEELQAETTVNAIVDNLEKQPYFDGRCINVEGLVSKVIQFAQENLLDSVTSIPIRVLAQNVQTEYMKRRPCKYINTQCAVSSVHGIKVKKKSK
ncbi:cilia- and flagella-associated protein 44 [Glossina fuscipes fuscipes]